MAAFNSSSDFVAFLSSKWKESSDLESKHQVDLKTQLPEI